MPAPSILVERKLVKNVPGEEKGYPGEELPREAARLVREGKRALIVAGGAWLLWRIAARDLWMRGDNLFLLEALDPVEAELAGLGLGQMVVARAAYQARIPAEKAGYENIGLKRKRVTRRALLSAAVAGAALSAVEKPVEGPLCATRGADRACRLCLEECEGNSCAAALCSVEMLEVPGYSRDALLEMLRIVSPRPPGYLVFAQRWAMASLIEQLKRGKPGARVYTVPLGCPYTVGLEELLAARALGLQPVIVGGGGGWEATGDPYCSRSREPYTEKVLGDYERLTGQKLEVLEPGEAAGQLRGRPEAPQPVRDALGLLTKGLHSLAVAEAERLTGGQGVEGLETLFMGEAVVDGDRCTLCGACVQECPANAFSLERREGGEELYFLPGRCIACRYCEEICPENALEIKRGVPADPGKWRKVASETVVRCLACGAPVAPRSLVVSVLRKMKAAGLKEGALISVLLCDRCRGLYQLGALQVDREKALRVIEDMLGEES